MRSTTTTFLGLALFGGVIFRRWETATDAALDVYRSAFVILYLDTNRGDFRRRIPDFSWFGFGYEVSGHKSVSNFELHLSAERVL